MYLEKKTTFITIVIISSKLSSSAHSLDSLPSVTGLPKHFLLRELPSSYPDV